MVTPTDKTAETKTEPPKVDPEKHIITVKVPAPGALNMAEIAPIERIEVLRFEHSGDRVVIHTKLPGAAYPFTDNLTLEFIASRGTGVEYCQNHFPSAAIELREMP